MSQLIAVAPSLLPKTRALWRRTSFVWGKHDCDLSVADYVQAATGIDPAARWRGAYSTESEAKAAQEAAGGNLALVDEGMTGAGFRRLTELQPGCVVVADFGASQITGIWTGRRGLFRLPRGAVEMPAQIIGAWA